MPRLTRRGTRLRPLGILRLEPALLDALRSGRGLGRVAAHALASILLGGAAYGLVFGVWRGAASALGSALKLPLVFLGVVLFTTLSSSVVAPVLRSSVSGARAAVVALVSFASTATVLGALAPAALLVVLSLPPLDPRALGLAPSDPNAAPSVAVAQALVLAHTGVIATAGIAGVLRLLSLLERLGDARAVARRVVLAWIATQFLVGAELSWRLRPFLGAPTTAVRLLAADALEGSFFEEIARLGAARFGAGAPGALALFALSVAAWLWVALQARVDEVGASVEPAGLRVVRPGEAGRLVPWASVRDVRANGPCVTVSLVPDASLDAPQLALACADDAAARALAGKLERARRDASCGPFRASAA